MANNFGRVNVSITASTGGLTAGLSRASKQLQGFKNSVSSVSTTLRSLGAAMAPLLPLFGVFATVAAAITALTSATTAAEALHNLSQETGVAAGDLQVLQQVAAETGVSQEAVTIALRRTSRMVGELARGTPSAIKAFAQLGLSMQDMAGLSVAEQFALISERIAALPPQMQAAAAIDMFGRSGQSLLNFIRTGSQGIGEMNTLLTQLGVKMSGEQVAAIEAMGDAIGRLSLPMKGFINQFLAGLAPAITTAANILVDFFAKNTSGWSMASTLANAFSQAIRGIAGSVTFLYGAFQALSAFVGVFIQGALKAFEGVTWALENMLSAMADAAESLPGFDMGLASSLRSAQQSVSALSSSAGEEAGLWGEAAANNFANGVRNMSDPFAAFDAEFANVTAQMQQAGQAAGQAAGDTISDSIKASTQALKAIVVGSSEGEAFRNSILRGADPRNEAAKDGARTADATERTADAVEELAGAMGGGIGLAEIGV